MFENVDIDVSEGEKVALIGQNGVGKSTIVKIILGETEADYGEVSDQPPGARRLPVAGRARRREPPDVRRAPHRLRPARPPRRPSSPPRQGGSRRSTTKPRFCRYTRLDEEYVRLGGYDFRVTIDMMLSRFGFAKDEYARIVRTFSGGEKTRIAFAKLLLQKPELLILDEPTNHMDIEIIEWLEDYLRKYPGAVLVITHDKYFINRVATKIYEIDQGTAAVYHGNFDML
ncbi:MAG: ATP-binding cassette domain-containing protein [Bacillus subtilis]|nr:ATP-binding cassette domain-containing protein [Bacillus subtilis]